MNTYVKVVREKAKKAIKVVPQARAQEHHENTLLALQTSQSSEIDMSPFISNTIPQNMNTKKGASTSQRKISQKIIPSPPSSFHLVKRGRSINNYSLTNHY